MCNIVKDESITLVAKGMVSRKSAAQYLGVTTMTLWRWTKEGRLPVVNIDSHIFYRTADLDRLKKEPRKRPG
jgi:excisionase family DNA binding protein